MTDRDLEAAIDAARAYRATIDQRHLVELSAFLTAAHRDISRLYARIVALPEIEPSETEYDRPEDAWTELYHDLQGMLGPIDNYREIFDPYGDEHEPPVVGSLSDAMAAVYADAMRDLGGRRRISGRCRLGTPARARHQPRAPCARCDAGPPCTSLRHPRGAASSVRRCSLRMVTTLRYRRPAGPLPLRI